MCRIMSAPGSGAQSSTTEVDLHSENQQKLESLLAELRAGVEADGMQRSAAMRQNLPRSVRLLGKAPLSHGMREVSQLLSALEGRALLPHARLDPRPRVVRSEKYLGIEDVVYTSAGVFYPNRRIALLFRSSVEEGADVSASPWDTGSLCASTEICPHLQPIDAGEERRALFQKMALPAPYYREYLTHYVAACFGSPEDYLYMAKSRHTDPAGALASGKWQSQVFEVRFRSRIPILPTTLVAAFVPTLAGDRDSLRLGELLNELEKQAVDVQEYDNFARLGRTVREWIHKHLRQEARP